MINEIRTWHADNRFDVTQNLNFQPRSKYFIIQSYVKGGGGGHQRQRRRAGIIWKQKPNLGDLCCRFIYCMSAELAMGAQVHVGTAGYGRTRRLHTIFVLWRRSELLHS